MIHTSKYDGFEYEIGKVLDPYDGKSFDIHVIFDNTHEGSHMVGWYFGNYDYDITEMYIKEYDKKIHDELNKEVKEYYKEYKESKDMKENTNLLEQTAKRMGMNVDYLADEYLEVRFGDENFVTILDIGDYDKTPSIEQIKRIEKSADKLKRLAMNIKENYEREEKLNELFSFIRAAYPSIRITYRYIKGIERIEVGRGVGKKERVYCDCPIIMLVDGAATEVINIDGDSLSSIMNEVTMACCRLYDENRYLGWALDNADELFNLKELANVVTEKKDRLIELSNMVLDANKVNGETLSDIGYEIQDIVSDINKAM